MLLGVCGAHDGGGAVGGVRTGVRGECGAEAVLAVGGGRGVVVLADEHDPQVAETGQVADDLGAGGDVVGADPGEPFQRVAAADVHGGVAVRDEPAQLVVRDVAAEEEAAVREPDPVQRPGVPRLGATGAGSGEEDQVVALGGGLLLDADEDRVVRVLDGGREGGGEAEDSEEVVPGGGQTAGRRVGHVTEFAGGGEHPGPGLLVQGDALLVAAEHQRHRRLRHPGEPGHLGLARSPAPLPGGSLFGHAALPRLMRISLRLRKGAGVLMRISQHLAAGRPRGSRGVERLIID